MSSAHRPTWAPAQGKEGRQNSKSYSARDLSGHTKLKFRQAGQGTQSEVTRRDLKLELLQAELDSNARKAKGEKGYVTDQKLLLLQQQQAGEGAQGEDEAAAKRRKVLQEAADLDKDDSEDEEEEGDEEEGEGKKDKGKGKATSDDEEEDEESSDDDDDEDETAELLRELEKIKKERAEEKERQEREREATDQISREEEIATGNPLLNLQAAMGASPAMSSYSSAASTAGGFGVKRRWDDDVIFKNQAPTEAPKAPSFQNDLLRTAYHKNFMKRYVA